jgi:ornithine cyclodeaminase
MAHIYNLDQIKSVLADLDPIADIEAGFVAYSGGRAVVPAVGELVFENPPGEAHIKYGYIKNADFYVIKIASGFYENPERGLPPYDGLMLLFEQTSGRLAAVLLDEGHLTNVRTAAAGAVAAKYLAPSAVRRIGIIGAGVQGRMQLEFLKSVTACRDAIVWGLSQTEVADFKSDMEPAGFRVETTLNVADVLRVCNLIVTATPSRTPLVKTDLIQPGTHITAMGSDTLDKIELEPDILARADIVVSDSRSQSRTRGEVSQALRAGALPSMDSVRELGEIISNPGLRRRSDDQITVADLTGVAVQDIQIAKSVYEALRKR